MCNVLLFIGVQIKAERWHFLLPNEPPQKGITLDSDNNNLFFRVSQLLFLFLFMPLGLTFAANLILFQ